MSGGGDLHVDVRRAPRVPAGGGDELAARSVGRDLVRRRLDRRDLEVTLVVGGEGGAQVPLRDTRGELRVEAVVVGVPDLDLRAGERGAVDVGDLSRPHERGTALV